MAFIGKAVVFAALIVAITGFPKRTTPSGGYGDKDPTTIPLIESGGYGNNVPTVISSIDSAISLLQAISTPPTESLEYYGR